MRANWRRLGDIGAILLCLALSLAACGVETLPVGGLVITYTTSVKVDTVTASAYHATLVASCWAGEQLIAGGYSATDVFESDYFLDASYPSAPNAWMVSVHSGSYFALQVYVYCLRSGPALGARIIQGSACPAGTTRLSQGQRGGAPYTLCAAHAVTAGATVGDFQVSSYTAHCANSSTGSNLSETRSFAYTCQFHQTQG